MAEIRLICPGCAAEYRLPEGAIPPSGREVECSACGRVWQAEAPRPVPLDLGDFAAAPAPAVQPLPPAASRLPASVLDILREEVEHERRLRAAEAEGRQPPVAAPAAESGGASDPETDWPATTVTLPAGAARGMIAAPQPQPDPQVDHGIIAPPPPPPVIRHAPPPAAEAAAVASPRAVPQRAAAADSSAERQPALPGRPRSEAKRAGFGLAVMLAAAALALYLLAPNLAQSGNPAGQRLMELRQEVDRGRLWLQDQADGLFG